jgi:DNA-binding FadR family transcriptional regulator
MIHAAADPRKRSFRKGRLSEQVADELERLIPVEFPNAGDTWPREADLADRFQVSRIVVREAIKILEERGVVEARAGRGTVTRTPTPDRVHSALLRLFRGRELPSIESMERLMEVRQVLEETVATLAAVRATPADLDRMRDALDRMERMEKAGSDDGDPDLEFHLSVASATHNPYFELVLQPLTGVFLELISLTNLSSVGIEEHRAVYEAIRERNGIAARQAVRRLMKLTATDLRRVLQSQPEPVDTVRRNFGAR